MGKAIPAHLDPANRAQRRLQVEEVPLLESTNLPPGAPPNTSADAGVDSTTQIIEMDSAMLGENIVQVN